MANKTLTALDIWSDPKSPVNGDAPDMALDEDCHQREANRTLYLKNRGVMLSTNDGLATGTWGSTSYGSALTSVTWAQLAGLGIALTGDNLKTGTVVMVFATIHGKCADASDIAHLRLVRVDDGGAVVPLTNTGGIISGTALQDKTLIAGMEIGSDLTSCEIQVEAKVLDASDSFQAYEPTDLTILVTRKN